MNMLGSENTAAKRRGLDPVPKRKVGPGANPVTLLVTSLVALCKFTLSKQLQGSSATRVTTLWLKKLVFLQCIYVGN